MSDPRLVECVHFRRKLMILYEIGSAADDEGLRISNDTALARYLAVPKSRVSVMRQGDDRSSSPRLPGMVQPADLSALAQLYCALSAQSITPDFASSLWTDAHYEEFRDHLREPLVQSLTEVLEKRRPDLVVTARASRTGRSMFDLDPGKDSAELTVYPGQYFHFVVKTNQDVHW